MSNIYGAELNRRGFFRTGGALVVGFSLIEREASQAAVPKNTLDAALPESFIEIHPDNTVLIRTGKCDFGQSSVYTAYRQIVADELDVPFDAITTVVIGDTDRTPDGSGTFDLLGRGVANLRKVAAYTRQAILEIASQRFGVPKEQISTKDGAVAGGG
ncbi:MAG: molybdopterin-dependent oxidoreductase, partial [Acidobacteriota bacterium]|nr:molybdopterin-dependent oxidoreductase [Acidobacteriota bacterium]